MISRMPYVLCKACRNEVVFRRLEAMQCHRLLLLPRFACPALLDQGSIFRVHSRPLLTYHCGDCRFLTPVIRVKSCSIFTLTLASVSRIARHLTSCRHYATAEKKARESDSPKKSLVEARESPYAGLTVGQKVKEVGKDATYTVVIIAGVAVTVLMFYVIGRELFSSESPSGLYAAAFKACQNNLQVTAALGEPLKGYGETTRRGRRRYISHSEFEVNGVPHMRLKFYIEGPHGKATVHAELKKGESSKYEYNHLIVETESYPHRTFILEGNR